MSPSSALIVPVRGSLTTGELEIKRSRFITWIGRADDGDEARELIALARAEYPDARHHCSAYVHEVPGANRVERSSDDGEPSGTAGRPMLDVLGGSGLTDVAAVVVRYFGGVKLGTGGLVRAYSDAVSDCLDRVPRARRVRREIRSVSVDAAEAGRVEAELRARGFVIADTEWGTVAKHRVEVAPGGAAELDGVLQAITHGTLTSDEAGEAWTETPL
ncbi:YigZ family protein [uncultured Corynebacterium sp.]|uniref:IMPACT family protein n=1 Tax=uncultured Corynebacterium sp. TaxID=159447 RepID=UPI0025D3E127|nr:YigZ family protein [uncultured Corynebacterium sp.]